MNRRPVLIAPPADVAARFGRIVDRILRHGSGCVHLEQRPVGVVCLMHPHIVRCTTCAVAHVRTHTEDQEHSCDLCGEHLDGPNRDDGHIAVLQAVEVDTTVSIGRGRRAAVGIIWLQGWGACEGCSPKLNVSAA